MSGVGVVQESLLVSLPRNKLNQKCKIVRSVSEIRIKGSSYLGLSDMVSISLDSP